MQEDNDNSGMSRGAMIAGGTVLLALAAAGYYYLYYAEEGPKRRRMMRSWMRRVKADVLEQIENLWSSNQEGYSKAMSQLQEKYKNLKNMDPAEIASLALRLRKHWREIQEEISSATARTGGQRRMQAGQKRGGRRGKRGGSRKKATSGSQASSS